MDDTQLGRKQVSPEDMPPCSFCGGGGSLEGVPVRAVMADKARTHAICVGCAMEFLDQVSKLVRAAGEPTAGKTLN